MKSAYEKWIFVSTVIAFVLVLGLELAPEDRARQVLERESEASFRIDRSVRLARDQAAREVVPEAELASSIERAFDAPRIQPEWGPLAGYAFYLSPPIPIGEPPPRERPAPLGAALNLLVERADPEAVVIRWDAVSRAEAYRVVRHVERAAGDPPVETAVPGGTSPRFEDVSIRGPARVRYEVTPIASNVEGEARSIEVDVPGPHRVEFLSVAFSGETPLATFRVEIRHDGRWYEHVFYQVRPGDRVGESRNDAGLLVHVECRPVAGGGALWLDCATPYVFVGLETERVPALRETREYLFRYGPGEADLAWAASRNEFRSSFPERGEPDYVSDERGDRVTRPALRPIHPDYLESRHRAILEDEPGRAGGTPSRIVLDPVSR